MRAQLEVLSSDKEKILYTRVRNINKNEKNKIILALRQWLLKVLQIFRATRNVLFTDNDYFETPLTHISSSITTRSGFSLNYSVL